MTSSLPIKSLLFYDAVMKHNSFTLAAQQLHVTPGAVGQQIQKLEEWLGTALFTRAVRSISPTAEGLRYWAAIQPALARIQQASEELRVSQAQEVWLSMPPTLAAKWFAPRMGGFLALRPDISLHLNATTALTDFERDRVDLAIRYFDGVDPALQSALIYRDDARMYCTPAYAQKHRIQSADDVVRATLLHTTLLPHWHEWLHRFSSLSDGQIQGIPSLHFDQSLLAIEAARHNQGVVLSNAILTEPDTQSGSLFEPLPLRLPTRKGYFLVHPRQSTLRPAAQALKNWLLALVQAESPHT